jgi:hypothetical protein
MQPHDLAMLNRIVFSLPYSRRRMRESTDLGLPGRAVSLPATMACYVGNYETLLQISYGMSTSDSKQNTGAFTVRIRENAFILFQF